MVRLQHIKKGQTTITCSALDGSGKSSQFLLTVKQQATSVTIDKTAVTVYIGKTETVTAKVLPDTADNKALNWEIDDSDVATVSSGRITGKAVGTATVRATTRDGSNITKEIKVTVLQQINTITLDKTSETLKSRTECNTRSIDKSDKAIKCRIGLVFG